MKPRSRPDRRGPSFLHPDWTKSELSRMIEIWRDLEADIVARRINPKEVAGGIDKRICILLSQQAGTTRTPGAVSSQRSHLYQAVRFISRFNVAQQVAGGRSWFKLSKEEQDRVPMTARERAICLNLTQESFNKLVKLKSVKKWTHFRKEKGLTPRAAMSSSNCSPSKCNASRPAAGVKDIVQAWILALQKSNTSVSSFVARGYEQSATLYTSWEYSTISAWRKMRRIAASYLFIRDFNERHAPARWFQLSDGDQDGLLDWEALPADFEDISEDIFDEISRVDTSSSAVNYEATTKQLVNQPRTAEIDTGQSDPDGCSDSPFTQNFSGSTESVKSQVNPVQRLPRPKLCTTSPHLSEDQAETQSATLQGTDHHEEFDASYDHVHKLQAKRLKKTVKQLRSDLERDISSTTDVVRAIFFERFGNPGQNGDATFVANLLGEQQRHVRDLLDTFEREHICDKVTSYAKFDAFMED
ncbi:unnamed protein product [Phytophthora lilii]|uniref:Unnamed protein product n=1 Tax=Phytophthora lilii TaxID=2077276 RepID=A0A9W6WSR9_9STRA|nr:unnamed protein product [Phytophthora lilii]